MGQRVLVYFRWWLDKERFMTREIPERDWKTLRRLTTRLLDRFCQKVLDEAVRLGEGSTQTSHERYLNLYRYLKKQDHLLGEAFDDHKRSTAFFKLANIYSLGLVTEEEFAEFSEETRDVILTIASR